ncbi:MAG: ArsA family ATPase, partial [Planctomycetota bacterium]
TALALAASGKRTLLVSTDPAGSLGDALRCDVGSEPVVVHPNLDAIQLDADAELQSLKDEYADEIEAFFDGLAMDLSFDREALENLLELAPTGLDEVMALVRMTEVLDAVLDDAYASIVLDTAPTGHTLRLLALPDIVQAWLEQIFAVLVKYEDMMSLPRLNERLLRLSRGLKVLRAMLADPAQTTLLSVTIPTRLAVAETCRLIEGSQTLGIPVSGVIVNQVTTAGQDPMSQAVASREQSEVNALHEAAGEIPVAQVSRGGELGGVGELASLGAALLKSSDSSGRRAA